LLSAAFFDAADNNGLFFVFHERKLVRSGR